MKIQKEDKTLLKWLGGFFDGEGFCSFSQGSPSIGINNTNPLAISRCKSLFEKYNIYTGIHERSPKSKKIRWDISINRADEAIKASEFLMPFVYGKRKQLELILEYSKTRKNAENFHRKMMYLNQTNNILIKDDNVLWKKLGFVLEKNHQNINDETSKIISLDFKDIHYLCGIIDGEGTIGINKRENKYRNTDRYTPVISFVNTNKEIIEKCVSTIKNLNLPCHIQLRISDVRNRARWDIQVSGIMRVDSFCNEIKENILVKKQQVELLHIYCRERLKSKKSSINMIGESYKEAIQKLNK